MQQAMEVSAHNQQQHMELTQQLVGARSPSRILTQDVTSPTSSAARPIVTPIPLPALSSPPQSAHVAKRPKAQYEVKEYCVSTYVDGAEKVTIRPASVLTPADMRLQDVMYSWYDKKWFLRTTSLNLTVEEKRLETVLTMFSKLVAFCKRFLDGETIDEIPSGNDPAALASWQVKMKTLSDTACSKLRQYLQDRNEECTRYVQTLKVYASYDAVIGIPPAEFPQSVVPVVDHAVEAYEVWTRVYYEKDISKITRKRRTRPTTVVEEEVQSDTLQENLENEVSKYINM